LRSSKSFADQAVIAIENVRLFNETKEALEQQTADLGSPAHHLQLSQRAEGSVRGHPRQRDVAVRGSLWRSVVARRRRVQDGALHGALPRAMANGNAGAAVPDVPLARVVTTRKSVHIVDMRTDSGYLSGAPLPVRGGRGRGMRTLLLVPMLKDNEVVGEVAIYRTEVRAFTDRQIAAHRELRRPGGDRDRERAPVKELEARNEDLGQLLDRQTATAEILGVIAGSPTDAQPVFDAVARNAAQLCEATNALVWRLEGEQLRLVTIPLDRRGPELHEASEPVMKGATSSR